jgi:chromosome segregation ATPase
VRELPPPLLALQASHQQHQSLQTQLREAESQRPLELGGEGAGGAAARRLAALANQVAECEGRVGAAGDELHRVVQEGERLAARLAELRAVPQRVARELAAVRDTITELAAEKEAARGQLQAAADVAEALAGQVALVQAKLAEAEGQFEGTLRDAEALCAREEAAEARAALAAHWAAQGHGEGEVAGLLEQRALVKHMEALERKIVKREADAQATYDELEVGLAVGRALSVCV